MGGGGSRPSAPAPIPVAPALPTTPKPTGIDPSAGLTLNTAQACADCDFQIDDGLSSSMVEMYRGYDPLHYDPAKPETAGKFSERTRAFINPTIPFKARYGGAEETFRKLSVYAPSPLRIENVQHDAVLQVGEQGVNSLILLIPLVVSSQTSESSKFMARVSNAIDSLSGANPNGMIQKPLTNDDPCPPEFPVDDHSGGNPAAPVTACKVKNPVGNKQGVDWEWKEKLTKTVLPTYPVATGNDWKLTHMIGSTDPYYTWLDTDYSWNPLFRQWFASSGGTRYIMLQNPVGVAANDMASITKLPVTRPTAMVSQLPTSIYYKAFPPKDCKTCVANTTAPPFPDIASASIETGAGPISNDSIVKILVGVIGGIALLIAIYFGLQFAMGPYGLALSKFGETLGRKMAQAARKLPSRAPGPSIRPGRPLSLGDAFPRSTDTFTGINPGVSQTQNPIRTPAAIAAAPAQAPPAVLAADPAAGTGLLPLPTPTQVADADLAAFRDIANRPAPALPNWTITPGRPTRRTRRPAFGPANRPPTIAQRVAALPPRVPSVVAETPSVLEPVAAAPSIVEPVAAAPSVLEPVVVRPRGRINLPPIAENRGIGHRTRRARERPPVPIIPQRTAADADRDLDEEFARIREYDPTAFNPQTASVPPPISAAPPSRVSLMDSYGPRESIRKRRQRLSRENVKPPPIWKGGRKNRNKK